jgi:hypothetical protein
MNNRLINTKVAGGGGGCTDIVDNYDPFGGNGVALYQLNGDATDVSGNYDGTASNVTYGTGVFGQAGVFNGSSSKITITNFQALSTFSVSMWIKASSQGQDKVILSPYNGSSLDANTLAVLNGGTQILIFTNSFPNNFSISASDTSALFNNNWNNLTYTVDTASNSLKIYINGVEKTTTRVGTTLPQLFSNIKLGVRWDDYSLQFFNGSIDQVRIFDTALTPLEIEALYTEELCICDGTVDTLDILGDGSCIATYQLDGNANDLSGNYSGTPTDVSYGVGEFDLAGVFNGSSSYVLIPDSPALRLTGDYAISFWFKTNSIGAIQRLINKDNANDYSGGWALVLEPDSSITWAHNDGSTNQNWNTGVSITANTWYYVTAVYSDSNNLRSFYLNGSLQNTITTNTNVASETDVLLFGAYGQSSPLGQYLNGSLDQVRIFNKALSAGEVTTLYNETACTKAACTGTTNTLDILGDGSCVATYPLDGSPADLSGNYNGVQTDVTYPVGEFDLAGAFNGVSSFINLGQQDQFANSQVSFSTWINPSVFTNGSTVILASTNGGSFAEDDFALYFRDDNVNGYIGTEVGQNSSIYEAKYTTTTAIPINAWTHIVLTFDTTLGTNITKVFINGVQQSLTSTYPPGGTFSGSILNSTLNLNIGKRNISGSELYFNGSIDQVRIFNKALSAGEVTTLYNETPCN